MSTVAHLRKFTALIIDCDGVRLDSNRIKTDAFRQVALRYGIEAADALVQFHVENGGVSRYRKFEHLLTHILGQPRNASELKALTEAYGEHVYSALLQCPVTAGLHDLRKATAGQAWMVVSGGDETELRTVFAARGLDVLFDKGIYGSPASKEVILKREKLSGNLQLPALFLGDSRYDHEVATQEGLHFVFVRRWSEFKEWRHYCAAYGVPLINDICDVASLYDIN